MFKQRDHEIDTKWTVASFLQQNVSWKTLNDWGLILMSTEKAWVPLKNYEGFLK